MKIFSTIFSKYSTKKWMQLDNRGGGGGGGGGKNFSEHKKKG